METEKTYRVGDYYLTRNRSGSWCRTWYDVQTKQRRSTSLGTKSFQDAKLKLEEWFVNKTSPVLDNDLELSRCLLEYWKQHAKHLTRSDTEKRNAAMWLEYFPEKLVREIRPPQQRQFIEHLKGKGYAKGTIESIFKTGSAAITFAWKNDMLGSPLPLVSATKHLAKYKMPKIERWRPLEVEELAKLFDNSNDKMVRFLMILIACACRPMAAIELHGSRVDKEKGLIDLLASDVQTNKYRSTVRLPSFIRCIYHDENLITQSSHVPNLNNLRNRDWLPARQKAQLDELVVPSSIRHTIARHLRAEGIKAWHVSAQLGHSAKGSEITEIYAPNDPNYLDNCLESIEGYFYEVYKKSEKLQDFDPLKSYSFVARSLQKEGKEDEDEG